MIFSKLEKKDENYLVQKRIKVDEKDHAQILKEQKAKLAPRQLKRPKPTEKDKKSGI